MDKIEDSQLQPGELSTEWGVGDVTPRYDWDDIAYFLGLVRHGQLVGAAKRLKVNHTTVSRRIRELEHSLNCKLFGRTKVGFVLTEAGQKFLSTLKQWSFELIPLPKR